MATQDSLVKYYDCLKASFNKIQVKDNKAALVNAALRPKIKEDLVQSKDLLISYLNYLQVFTPIYRDKFGAVCSSIICPLFREHPPKFNIPRGQGADENIVEATNETAILIHKSMKEILKSDQELTEDYVLSVVRQFPHPYNDEHQSFINYNENSLEICGYVRAEPLTILATKILEMINPTISRDQDQEEKLSRCKKSVSAVYDAIYQRLESLEKRQLDNVSAAMLAAFSREFLTSENEDSLNYLILFICSQDDKLVDLFMNLLWAVFTDSSRPLEDRRASVYYACSLMAKASYVDLSRVLNFLETGVVWCNEILADIDIENDKGPSHATESSQLYFSLVESMLYLLTQRYRELYEKESIDRIKSLDLDKILNSPLKPLEVCDIETEQRFRELAALYGLSSLRPVESSSSARKRRKSDQNRILRTVRKFPFKETNNALPNNVKELYRNYFDHRNFTVYRE